MTWDTRFETPLSNLVPATDENGKMKWDNMNTIERIHLSPSRPKVGFKFVVSPKYENENSSPPPHRLT